MTPRPNVSDERKSQIINAAEEVFTRKGFEEARMDDIAEETGLSKGTLYLYFKSKDDLILSILDRIFQLDFRRLEKLNQPDMSAREVLLSLIEVIAQDAARIRRLLPIL